LHSQANPHYLKNHLEFKDCRTFCFRPC